MSVRACAMIASFIASGCTALAAPPDLAECTVDGDCDVIGAAQGYGDCPAYTCREGRCERRGTLLSDDALLVEVDALELGTRQLRRSSEPVEGGLDLVLTATERGPLAAHLVVERTGFGMPAPLGVLANPYQHSPEGELVPGCYTIANVPDATCVAVQRSGWVFVDAASRARPAQNGGHDVVARGVESDDARTVGFRGIATHGGSVRSATSAGLAGSAVVALSTSAASNRVECAMSTELEIISVHEVSVGTQRALTTSGGGAADAMGATAGDGSPAVLASPSGASALVVYGSASGELVVLEVTPPSDVSTDPVVPTPSLLPEHVRELARIRDTRPVGALVAAMIGASEASQLLLVWTPPCPDTSPPLHGRLLTLEHEAGSVGSIQAGDELELAAAIAFSDQLTIDAALPFALTAMADGSGFLAAWREGAAPLVSLRLAFVTPAGDVRALPSAAPTEQPLPRGLALRATSPGHTSVLLEGNDDTGANQLWLGELCEIERP